MEHSHKFDLVKMYYDAQAWNKEMVLNAVVKHWITLEEYKEITKDKQNG